MPQLEWLREAFVQEGRRMVETYREPDDTAHDPILIEERIDEWMRESWFTPQDYKDIEIDCQSWDDTFQPRFYDFETSQVQHGDYSLQCHIRSWMDLAEHGGLGVAYATLRE
jgi:hypothetical protein